MTAKFTVEQVRRIATSAIGAPVREVQHLPVGYGNENWRVATSSAAFILKLGPPGSAAKWAATHDVYRLGRDAGLPLPELVHFEAAGDAVARHATWATTNRRS